MPYIRGETVVVRVDPGVIIQITFVHDEKRNWVIEGNSPDYRAYLVGVSVGPSACSQLRGYLSNKTLNVVNADIR